MTSYWVGGTDCVMTEGKTEWSETGTVVLGEEFFVVQLI